MYAIIIGAGRTGTGLARILASRGARVALVDIRPDLAAETLPGIDLVPADGASIAGLLQANAAQADVLIAVTDSDETNLLAAALAHAKFAVPRVLARALDPAQRWLYDSAMGIDLVLDDAEWLAQFVMGDLSPEAVTRLTRLRAAGLTLHEAEVLPDSRAIQQPFGAIAFPAGSVPVTVYRGGEALAPRPDLVIQAGDVVAAVAPHGQGPALATALNPPEPEPPAIEVIAETPAEAAAETPAAETEGPTSAAEEAPAGEAEGSAPSAEETPAADAEDQARPPQGDPNAHDTPS